MDDKIKDSFIDFVSGSRKNSYAFSLYKKELKYYPDCDIETFLSRVDVMFFDYDFYYNFRSTLSNLTQCMIDGTITPDLVRHLIRQSFIRDTAESIITKLNLYDEGMTMEDIVMWRITYDYE